MIQNQKITKIASRCDGVAQCPSGENFNGGEEDEGDFCEGSGGGQTGEEDDGEVEEVAEEVDGEVVDEKEEVDREVVDEEEVVDGDEVDEEVDS